MNWEFQVSTMDMQALMEYNNNAAKSIETDRLIFPRVRKLA